MDIHKALLTCRIATLARSHGQTSDDGSQSRAAMLVATDDPHNFLLAMLPGVEDAGLRFREVFPGRTVNLAVDRDPVRLFRWTLPFHRVTETWPGAYSPAEILAQSLLMEHRGDDPVIVESETSIANGAQFLIWDKAWGTDTNMINALAAFDVRAKAAQDASN